MPVSWIEKVLYPVTVGILYSAGRTHLETVFVALLDLVWLALFILAWVRTPERY